MNSLMNSMSLVLDEFQNNLKVSDCIFQTSKLVEYEAVGVSSMTGDGMGQFLEAVEASREEDEKYVSPYQQIHKLI